MKTIIVGLLLLVAGTAAAADAPGRYQVIYGKTIALDRMILVDTITGQTWLLEGAAWKPLSKMSDDQAKAIDAKRAKDFAAREQLEKDTRR